MSADGSVARFALVRSVGGRVVTPGRESGKQELGSMRHYRVRQGELFRARLARLSSRCHFLKSASVRYTVHGYLGI